MRDLVRQGKDARLIYYTFNAEYKCERDLAQCIAVCSSVPRGLKSGGPEARTQRKMAMQQRRRSLGPRAVGISRGLETHRLRGVVPGAEHTREVDTVNTYGRSLSIYLLWT